MKKDKEWLKEEVKQESGEIQHFSKSYYDEDKVVLLDDVNELIDQLEEPKRSDKMLSQAVYDSRDKLKSAITLSSGARKIVDDIFNEMYTQLEETEITEEQAWEVIERENHYHIAPSQVKEYKRLIRAGTVLDDVFEKEKPVIPQFVADWLEECKGWDEDSQTYEEDNNTGFLSAMDEGTCGMSAPVTQWFRKKGNEETFAHAWLDGDYEIEKEKLYYICMHDGTFLVSDDDKGVNEKTAYFMHQEDSGFLNRVHQFTEQQIKDVSVKYWSLAEEVVE